MSTLERFTTVEPAHWAEGPTRHNNAHLPIYLGRWPD